MEQQKNFMKKCEICNLYATNLCYECMSYFCNSCFQFVHEKDYNSKHKKEEIDYYAPVDTKCSLHKNNPLNLFCLEEQGKFK